MFFSEAEVDDSTLTAAENSLKAEGVTGVETSDPIDPITELGTIDGVDSSTLETFKTEATAAAATTPPSPPPPPPPPRRPVAPASAAEYIAPPYLTRLFPDKGHVVGGTSVTIFGGGFVRSPYASVRFAHASGEVDVVPAHFVDSSRIVCITPERTTSGPHVAHVSVSNDGATYTSFPLVEDPDEDDGTYLHFTFADDAPKGEFILIRVWAIRMTDGMFILTGRWTLDHSAGPAAGGTAVVIRNRDASDSSRLASDTPFLPGRHLRCRFGNARNVTDATIFNGESLF